MNQITAAEAEQLVHDAGDFGDQRVEVSSEPTGRNQATKLCRISIYTAQNVEVNTLYYVLTDDGHSPLYFTFYDSYDHSGCESSRTGMLGIIAQFLVFYTVTRAEPTE